MADPDAELREFDAKVRAGDGAVDVILEQSPC